MNTKMAGVLAAVLTATWIAGSPPATHAAAAAVELKPVVLGKGPAPEVLRMDAGAFTLTAAGREAYSGRDEGSFAGLETDAPAFTFIARIARGAEDVVGARYGIAIRAGLEGHDKAVQLRFDGHEKSRCVAWFMRHHVAPTDHDGAQRCRRTGTEPDLKAGSGIWLKVVRRYPYVRTYHSEDGKAWREVGAGHLKALLPQRVHVGLQAGAGGDGSRTIAVTFDQVSFTVDEAPAETAAAVMREYRPPVRPYRMFLATVPPEGGKGSPSSAFLLMPRDMAPESIRAILWSAGSKEEVVGGKAMEWEKGGKGQEQMRRPAGLKEWEGTLDLDDVRAFVQLPEHHGMVRVGGYFPPKQYDAGIRRLAELSGIAHLPNIPFVVTGASFAGGWSAQGAAAFPERTIAAAPVIIGSAGSNTADPRVLATPHLHLFGSKDGAHLRDVRAAIPLLRDKGALWASAPMWTVAHRQHKADALIYPYFVEAMRLRLPVDADATKGPVALKPLRYEDGYLGLVETWESNFPQVVKASEYEGASKDLVWLPGPESARAWQAFCSFDPRTIIHCPMFDGRSTFGGPAPFGWHNSWLAADEPFELVATGPLGPGLKVEYFAGTRRLRVLREHGHPYRVTLEPLPEGLHAIHAVTMLDGAPPEISRPVTILAQRRR